MNNELTTTQNLLLEVLIARARLGEAIWTFDRTGASIRAADRLEKLGLIVVLSGSVEKTFRASLTLEAKASHMARPYRAPLLEPLRTLIDGTEWDVASWRENWRNTSLALYATATAQEEKK